MKSFGRTASEVFFGTGSQMTTRRFGTMVNGMGWVLNRRRGIDRAHIDFDAPDSIAPARFDGIIDLSNPESANPVDHDAVKRRARALENQKRQTAIVYDNVARKSKQTTAHVYAYDSRSLTMSPEAIDVVAKSGNNAKRLLVRQFFNNGLEIPQSVADAAIARFKRGGSASSALDGVATSPEVIAHYTRRLKDNAPLTGSVLLGENSIVQLLEAFRLEDGARLIDVLHPATSALHVWDGHAIWIRTVNTKTGETSFSVLGGGKHNYPIVDLFNMVSAPPTWDVLASIQPHLYEVLAASGGRVPDNLHELVLDAIRRKDSSLARDYKVLSVMDQSSGFLARLRRQKPTETGRGLVASDLAPPSNSELALARRVIDEAAQDDGYALVTPSQETAIVKELGGDVLPSSVGAETGVPGLPGQEGRPGEGLPGEHDIPGETGAPGEGMPPAESGFPGRGPGEAVGPGPSPFPGDGPGLR